MMVELRAAGAALAIAGAVMAGLARAEQPASVWQGCGENKVSGFAKFMVGPTAARNQNSKASADEGIARCSEALKALDAAVPWQRRAALLRSRAKYYVMGRQPEAAIADLDAIAAIEQPGTVYARSFGVSTHMLRATAKLEVGQRDDAAREAFEAMRLRPWSERVAQFAYAVSTLRDKVPSGEGSRWDRLVMLDGAFAERRAILLAQSGDWAAATVDWMRVSPAPGDVTLTYVNIPNVVVQGLPGIPLKGADVRRSVDAALTAAMAGRADMAEGWLAKLRVNIDSPPPVDAWAKRLGAATDPAAQKAELETWAGLIKVARLAGSGGVAEAAILLDSMNTIPVSPISVAMMHSIAAGSSGPAADGLRVRLAKVDEHLAGERQKRLADIDPSIFLQDLPDHEEAMLANPYRSAVKFLRANGTSVKVAKDGKTAQISFFGDRSQPFAIGEMTLLRAAELTREQQHRAFRIVSSNDYVQTSTMTMYGVAVGQPTVSGNSALMSIEFVDPDAPGAVDADTVRAALGPIYIKEAPETKS